ncbi:MAG TPA: prolipoprotein diacylglyceryl transferase family protein, partial [Kofleriaceae bacterium]
MAHPGSGLSRLARPTIRGVSTYTVLGFAGYAVASALGAALAIAWRLSLGDRLDALIAPPLAFLAVVHANRRYHGRERIVFYQTASAAVVSAAAVSFVLGGHPARVADVATAGIGAFLVFGRAGCFSVACCHGRPARHGIAYGPAHVAVGFWSRWSGRTLWPVQLIEAAASGALVAIALAIGWDDPGAPALIYTIAYGCVRFALELV